ncbi:MAG: tRNA (N(6)-L-threonylcarbamoyladenosine(37)-C(2))-methylthiotransferase MtaB [Coriobacteriia bacterium]|nr:tRNA (N(6)-L-threonylcarbamoyladenosine(37)-C(2))-methylthiotransferase MtaB [Coriobacteriia bacterium]MCL2746445.1 tRNA (N(6)-L-threonylcarbamoyladenosine(37)-C(2))-methylthiotransferase MtaB [Coriobacteriia bacterium]MCL2870691.1 tRNA (N(6)-L-threonylcarbamoyladenosine(37)-C(2))-methylthiotransferase MtaB [Coriobacteriia bacterium]
MARYFIKTFGCKVNQAESDSLYTALMKMGMQHASDVAEADFVIIYTCTVTGEADRKVRKELRRATRLLNIASIVVTGCAANLNKEELESLDEKIRVICSQDEIVNFFSSHSETLPITKDGSDSTNLDKPHHERIRMPIKVQDGCEDFCSYCIVPFARGECKSVNPHVIIEQIQKAAERGVKEAVLTGINLGNYANSSSSNCLNLAQLLHQIRTKTDMHRIRLSSIEPRHVTNDLLVELSEEKGILCEHLHIPLQSGSDYVLGDMNRGYSTSEYLQLVQKIRAVKPHTAITTDIIVGYPSESDEDFQATLDTVRKVGFSKVHIFRYSPREGTAASHLKPLNPRIVKKRAHLLREQAEQDALQYRKSRAGHQLEMIVEQLDEDEGMITGTTREYLRLTLAADNHNPGDIVFTKAENAL